MYLKFNFKGNDENETREQVIEKTIKEAMKRVEETRKPIAIGGVVLPEERIALKKRFEPNSYVVSVRLNNRRYAIKIIIGETQQH